MALRARLEETDHQEKKCEKSFFALDWKETTSFFYSRVIPACQDLGNCLDQKEPRYVAQASA